MDIVKGSFHHLKKIAVLQALVRCTEFHILGPFSRTCK